MPGHGTKMERLQDVAIAALLTLPTHAEAAAHIGISESTLYSWLARPEFKTPYRAARREVVEVAVAKLQASMSEAVETLRLVMKSGSEQAKVRAAIAILTKGADGTETLDLLERVEELERRLAGEDDDDGQAAGEDQEGPGEDDAAGDGLPPG